MILSVASGNKRKNSTRQLPPASRFEIYLKDNCSMIDPVFILSLDTEVFPKWAEVYFDDKYYFVNDIVQVHDNLFEIHCHVDVLATWKSLILNTPAFVEHYTHTNNSIPDQRLGIKANATRAEATATVPELDFTTGSYVVNITGETNNGAFKVGSYNDLIDLIPVWSDIWDDISSNFTADWLENICLVVGNMLYSGDVTKNYRDAWWTPWKLPADTGNRLVVGKYRTNVVGGKLDGVHIIPTSVNIPWQFNDWRNSSPYTKIFLSLPLVGTIPIAVSEVYGLSYLSIRYCVSKVDGTFTVFVYADDKEIYSTSGDASSHFMIGRGGAIQGSIVGTAAKTALGVAAGVATGGAAGALAVAGSAASGAFSMLDTGSSGGGLSGASAAVTIGTVKCFTICHDTAENPHNIAAIGGEPALISMNTLPSSGYVQTRGFSVKADQISAGAITMQEIEEINSLLDSGIYIE